MFTPDPYGGHDLESFIIWVTQQFNKLANIHAEFETDYVRFTIFHSEPDKPQEAMIYYADGSDWDPGHGAGLYYYHETHWHPMFSLANDVITSTTTVVNTVTETTIFTATIAADKLLASEVFILHLMGHYGVNTGADTWTIRIKLNGTTIDTVTRASAGNVSNVGWDLRWQFTTRTAGSGGTFLSGGYIIDNDAVQTTGTPGSSSIDTTAANTITVTVQWGAADANNTFSIDEGNTDYLHP